MTKSLKVLIADDSLLMQTVMKTIFNSLLSAPDIMACSSLKDTFDILRQQSFDFLLLDINMPGGDSKPESIRQMHELQAGLKICMFTGNDKKTLSPAYIAAGAVGFIQKDDKIAMALEEVLKDAFS